MELKIQFPPPPTPLHPPPPLSSHAWSLHLELTLNNAKCMNFVSVGADVVAERFPWNPQIMLQLPVKRLQEKMKWHIALETFLFRASDAFSCAFPERRTQRKEMALRRVAVNHCIQWQKGHNTRVKPTLKTSLFVYRWGVPAGRRRKCRWSLFGYQWQTGNSFVF